MSYKIKGMYQKICFILMKAGVTGPEIDECMIWAFGPGVWLAPIYPDWTNRWNKLHQDLFHAGSKDKFVEFIYVIGHLFVQEKKKGKGNGKK